MTCRDALKTVGWWREWTKFSVGSIKEREKAKEKPPENPSYEPQFVLDLAFAHARLLLRRYSRGEPAGALSELFPPLLHYWEESERLGLEIWTPEQQWMRHSWEANLGFYIDCFWLIGLALSLEISDEQWSRLLVLVGNEGEDALLDRVIATRSPQRKVGASLCYPQPYVRLMDAIDAETERQPGLLAQFAEHWYTEVGRAAGTGRVRQALALRKPYWHGNHRIEGAYFGYWCVEAVAAVKAFGLDDSLCVGHPHYPGDLLRPGQVTAPDISRLPRQLAGAIDVPPPPSDNDTSQSSAWATLKCLVKRGLDR